MSPFSDEVISQSDLSDAEKERIAAKDDELALVFGVLVDLAPPWTTFSEEERERLLREVEESILEEDAE